MPWRTHLPTYVMDYFYKFDPNIIILKSLYPSHDRCASSAHPKNYVFAKFCHSKHEKAQEAAISTERMETAGCRARLRHTVWKSPSSNEEHEKEEREVLQHPRERFGSH
ncbi:uncharacterized protein [Physcomitrium patens]|uniref:uncharacterized protein isoform X1 n=1 Tax=Physcomitrium patens TaxID=3218 RepID=UPI003CCD2D95